MFIVQPTGDGRWLAIVQTGKSRFTIYRDSKSEAARCGAFFLPTETTVKIPTANPNATSTAPRAEGIKQ
jgi:hypothetical protein